MLNLYHDDSRNLAVYKTDQPAYITNHIAQAQQVNGSVVAVPVNLFNMQLAARLNLPILPVMHDYDWPISPDKVPLPHQKIMANFMVCNPYSFNLSDMGTMKTLSTLWACDWLMRQHPEGQCRALIVGPLSVLRRTWESAIFQNFLGRRTVKVVYGSADQRARLLAEPADFYVINYDGISVGARMRRKLTLEGLSATLRDRTDIQICIIDEASAFRDSRTRRWRIASMLCRRNYLWLLTGTPTPNGPTDAYGLAKLVNGAFGESFGSFKSRTMIQVSQYKWLPARWGYQDARRLLTPSIRFELKDVWNGPELTTQQRDIALSPQQARLIQIIKTQLGLAMQQGRVTTANAADVRNKILQITQGAVYDPNHQPLYVDATPRLKELSWVIENAAMGKIICLAPFTSIVHLVYNHLRKSGIKTEMVYGDVPEKARTAIFTEFQNNPEGPRVLVADPRCMAHGLDLFAAQTVIWYGPNDKAELYWQANRRAYRPGQRHPVCVVQLTSTNLEREIYRRLEKREEMQNVLLDMVKRGEL